MIENDTFVSQLRTAIADGGAGLADVPALLKEIIREGRWKLRKIKTGNEVPFARFEEFVTTKPLEGLGATMDLLKRLCADDNDACNLIDQSIGKHQGEKPNFVNNINEVEDRPQGTSKQRAIRHLREKRPDIHARVLAGELSPHAGMVEAGFRPRSITIPDDPEGAARRIRRHFEGDRLAALIAALQRETPA